MTAVLRKGDHQRFAGHIRVTEALHFFLRLDERRLQLAAGFRLCCGAASGRRQVHERTAHIGSHRLRIAASVFDEGTPRAVLLTKQCVGQVQCFDLRIARCRGALHSVADGLLRHRSELDAHISSFLYLVGRA